MRSGLVQPPALSANDCGLGGTRLGDADLDAYATRRSTETAVVMLEPLSTA